VRHVVLELRPVRPDFCYIFSQYLVDCKVCGFMVTHSSKQSIFRSEAFRHYADRQAPAIFPRFVSAYTFRFLWLLLALLLASVCLVWAIRVPAFVSGPAIVVTREEISSLCPDKVSLVAFLSPENHGQLQVGQPLFVQPGSFRERTRYSIVAVEPKIVSPAVGEQRFGLNGRITWSPDRPAAVIVACLQPALSDLPLEAHIGAVYRVDVEVGTRRVVSFLPFIGSYFTSSGL
jgi:hypothetical protein